MKAKLVAQLMKTAAMKDEEMVKYMATISRKKAAKLYSAASEVDHYIQMDRPHVYPQELRTGIWLVELNAKARWDNHIKDAVTV